ncbi:MAG: hypothetical protein J6Y43_03555 [Clostridia bacterium]|nr:hypothetical protein [Clostridia bacterium]
MKKTGIILLSLIMLLTIAFGFSACGNGEKLPSTAYEKVRFAFNGVEKSFENASSGNKSASKYKTQNGYGAVAVAYAAELFSASDNFNDALTAIDGVYESPADDQGDVIDDLEYTQPPMIQFQCLNKVLDKTGDNYSFGTKYGDEINGELYADMENGIKKDKTAADAADYKYDYTFGLAISINIDRNDLIIADVSFEIRVYRENEDYRTSWYVNLSLDYDMTDTTPNYTLTMYTANDEKALPSRNGYTYEYDYVQVADNKINEWRKFDIETSDALIKDAAHSSFDDYENADGFEYRIGAHKWYKNKNLRKITQITETEKNTVANALFGGLGLNETDINPAAFIQKDETENAAITELYREFSVLFGDDLIYDLITEDEKHGDEDRTPVGIVIQGIEPDSTWNNLTVENDALLSELMSSDGPWGTNFGLSHPCIWYVDKNGAVLQRLENYDDLDYTVSLGNEKTDMALNRKLSDVLANELGGMAAVEAAGFKITFTLTDKEHPDWTASFDAYVGFREEIEQIEAKFFPDELTEMGVPEYQSKNASYRKVENGKEGQIGYDCTDTSRDEYDAYIAILGRAGFYKDEFGYYLKHSDTEVLKLELRIDYQNNAFIGAEIVDNSTWAYTSTMQLPLIKEWLSGRFDNFPAPDRSTLYFSSYADKYVYIYGLSFDERDAYIAEFADLPDVILDEETRIVRYYYDGYYYAFEYYADDNLDYLYLELNPERHSVLTAYMIQINGNTPQRMAINNVNGDLSEITVKLRENDTFVFLPNQEYKILCREGKNMGYFDCDDDTGVHTVCESGTYKFFFGEGQMRVEKQVN